MSRHHSLAMKLTHLLLGLACAVSPACLQVEPQKQIQRAHALVTESTGQAEVYDPYAPAITSDEVDAMLADGLTLQEAQRLALLHGEDLRAEFQEIGIAQADWVQSQLLSNPSVDLLVGFPDAGGRTLFEALLSVELLELWRIPVREAAAQERLQATVLHIARRAGEILADTRAAYGHAVAQRARLALAQEKVELTTRGMEAALALQKAGSAEEATTNVAKGFLLDARLELLAAEVAVQKATSALAAMLSVAESMAETALLDALPESIPAAGATEELVELALRSRLDLQAMEREIKALEHTLQGQGRSAWGDVKGNGYRERPAEDGTTIHGVGVGLTLPLFDQNQAQLARAQFQLEELRHTYNSTRIKIAQAVRHHAARVDGVARSLQLHSDEWLPLASRNLDLARVAFEAGTIDIPDWTDAQDQMLRARFAKIRLQEEAATAIAELERVLGKRLPSSAD